MQQPELAELIHSARIATHRQPHVGVGPAMRQMIYRVLDGAAPSALRPARGALDVATARLVLPYWRAVWPADGLAPRLLDLTMATLGGHHAPDAALILRRAWSTLEVLGTIGVGMPDTPQHRAAFFAGAAAYQAFATTCGADPFSDEDYDRSDTDAVLDPYTSDTAVFAATAYQWNAGVDTSLLPFWDWWLNQALASAHDR